MVYDYRIFALIFADYFCMTADILRAFAFIRLNKVCRTNKFWDLEKFYSSVRWSTADLYPIWYQRLVGKGTRQGLTGGDRPVVSHRHGQI